MSERKSYFDYLRIIAILFVIYNHTNERGYFLYAFPSSTILNCFYIAFAALIAVAVPIFFMISGALLLPKDETIKDLFQKRVSRIVWIILIFSVIQYVIKIIDGKEEISLLYYVKRIFQEGMIAPYWFLYAYLAFLLMLPFMRKLTKVISKNDYLYLFALLLIIKGIVPLVLYPFDVCEINSFMNLPLIDNTIVYPFLGYYIENYVSEDAYNKKNTRRIIIFMTLVLCVFVLMTRVRALPYEDFTMYDKGLYTCSLTMILVVGVFYLVKNHWLKSQVKYGRNIKRDTIVRFISEATFGIYLIEEPVREHTTFICDMARQYIGRFPACIIWDVCIFGISYVIVMLMKQIPGIKKLL